MEKTLTVDGRQRTAVEAYSCGPGSPIHTYVLRGGDRLEKIGDNWQIEIKGSAFWEPRKRVEVAA